MQTPLFYSDEQFREFQDEQFGDGYSNEFQRCYAQQLIERPLRNETAQARRLTEAGKFVVIQAWARYCNVTDAILGEEVAIVESFDIEEDAWALVYKLNDRDCDDCSTSLFRLPAPPAPAPDRDPDEIPF